MAGNGLWNDLSMAVLGLFASHSGSWWNLIVLLKQVGFSELSRASLQLFAERSLQQPR